MKQLNAAEERLQKNAIIIFARQAIYRAALLEYGNATAIGAFAEIITKGTTPKTYGFGFVESGIPFLRAEEVADGEVLYEDTPFHIDLKTNDFMDRSRTQPGDVLITIAGTIGRAAVVPASAPELNMNQAVALIRCKKEIDPYFLFHMLQSQGVQEYIRGSTVTTAISNLSLGKIKELLIPLPPVDEQRVLANFLEAVRRQDDLGDATLLPRYARNIPNSVALIKQLAAKIEEARGLRQRSTEEAEALSSSSFSKVFDELVKEYGTVSIGSFADVKGGKRLPAGQSLVDTPTPFKYIRVTDMENHSVNKTGLKYVPEYIQPLISNYTISSDDVYITIAGTIGYPGTIPQELNNVNLTENAAKLVFHDRDTVSKEYIVYAARSPQVQDQFNQKRTIAAQPKLALHRIGSTQLPLPPLEEQRRIVAYLDGLQAKVDALKQLQSQTQAELDALLPSVLDKAFKGEL